MSAPSSPPHETQLASRKVFITHGSNLKARNAIKKFLLDAGLIPVLFEDAADAAVKGLRELNPPIHHIIESGFKTCQAVAVILTGDDMARLKRPYKTESLRPQPRPNVLFEAGWALGHALDRTLVIQVGELRGLSDMGGMHVIRLDGKRDGTADPRISILNRLMEAGCEIDQPHRDRALGTPLPTDLFEDEPRSIEMRTRNLFGLCGVIALVSAALALGTKSLDAHLFQPEVRFNSKTPVDGVTAYLSVDDENLDRGQPFTLRLRPEDDRVRFVFVDRYKHRFYGTLQAQPGRPVTTMPDFFSVVQPADEARADASVPPKVSDKEAEAFLK